MRAIVKQINFDYRKDKDGNRKRVVVFKCEDKDGKTYWGDYNEEYARKYFAFCNQLAKDLPGKEVDITTYEYQDKEGKTKERIRFLNCLDEKDKPIVMPKELDF